MKLDISINSDEGLSTIPIIKKHLDSMPALRPLVLLLKVFLTRRSLNSAATGGLGSFGLILLVISFLQVSKAHSLGLDTLHIAS